MNTIITIGRQYGSGGRDIGQMLSKKLGFDFYDKELVIFFPECNRHSVSQMIYFSEKKKNKVYIGKCTPILLNPNLFKTLSGTFKIKSITSLKKDLEEILK